MGFKKTVVLLLIFALIYGFYHFKIKSDQSTENLFSFSKEAKSSRVLDLKKDETIQKFVLKDFVRDSEITLVRQADQSWQIKQPVDYPAESLVINGFVTLLKLAPRSRELSITGSDLVELGFANPSLKICVTTNWNKERCLLIGEDAAVVEGAYAKWEDESTYFLVNINFLNSFDKTLYSLRAKHVFHFEGKEISEIDFRLKDQQFLLENKNQNWVLIKPKEISLTPDSMDALFLVLHNLFIKYFLDSEPSNDPKYGLDSGQVMQITFKDGTKQRLVWGSEAFGFDAYYAQGPRTKTLLLISQGNLNQLIQQFNSLI